MLRWHSVAGERAPVDETARQLLQIRSINMYVPFYHVLNPAPYLVVVCGRAQGPKEVQRLALKRVQDDFHVCHAKPIILQIT